MKYLLNFFSWWIIKTPPKKSSIEAILVDLNIVSNLYLWLYLYPTKSGLSGYYNNSTKLDLIAGLLMDLKEILYFDPIKNKEVIIRLNKVINEIDSDTLGKLIIVIKDILESEYLNKEQIYKWLEKELYDIWGSGITDYTDINNSTDYINHLNEKIKDMVTELNNNGLRLDKNINDINGIREEFNSKVGLIYREMYQLLTNESSVIMDANINLINTIHFTPGYNRELFKPIVIRNTSNENGIFKKLAYKPFEI